MKICKIAGLFWAISSATSALASGANCISSIAIVELQPYKIICSGTTTESTSTRTYNGCETTPPDITTSVSGTCTAATPCPPVTIPPPADCTHPCTTTVSFFYPPPSLTSVPPDITTTIIGSCTATTSCPPITVPPPADCTHPCTTRITTYPPPTSTPSSSSTSIPPDITTTIIGSCTATTSCSPITVPPPADCTHPCTTRITTYPPPTSTPSPSSTSIPPDITTTIIGSCTATTSCSPITVSPPADCTHPCTTKITTYPPSPQTPSSSSTPSPTASSPSSLNTPSSTTPRLSSSTTSPTTSSSSILSTTPPTVSSPSSSSTPSSTTLSSSSSSTPSPTTPSPSSSTPSSTTSSSSSSSTPSPTTPSPSSSTPPTTTSSSTSSSTTSKCAKPTCSAGIKRAQYPDPFTNGGGFNEQFNTTYYKQTEPTNQTIVDSFSDIGDAEDNFISYEYAAFVYSCQGGSFFFNITNADDIGLAWFGSTACGDFEKNNNQSSSSYEGGPGQGKSFTVTLEAEQYYPIRLIYVNAAGPAKLDLEVTGPQGDVEDSNDYSYYPTACDSSNSFVDFGSEAQEGKSCTSS